MSSYEPPSKGTLDFIGAFQIPSARSDERMDSMNAANTKRKAPKPRRPSRAKGALKDSSKKGTGKKGSPAKSPRVTTAQLAQRLERVADSVDRIERKLSPSDESKGPSADEQALLNLVDAIVEGRTEAALVPLARLATLVERLAISNEEERAALSRDTLEQLVLVLDAAGVERISPERGEELNPMLHQEVEELFDTELDEGLCVHVVRPGFRVRGGRLLIPALVAVSGGKREE